VLKLHGFEDRLEPLRRAFVKKDFATMTEIALPMVDSLAVAGSEDECRVRLSGFEGLVDRVILGGAWIGPSEERLLESHRAILEAFAPDRR